MSDPRELIQEAEKLLKPQGWFLLVISGSSQYSRQEEASDLYVQAGNQYLLNRDFANAATQFVKASEIQKELRNDNDMANYLIEAYKSYKFVSPQDAISCLSKAIDIYSARNGQFRRAANCSMDLGSLYESIPDLEKAAQAYEKAGQLYTVDHAEALSSKAYTSCADLYASSGQYSKAIEYYDSVSKVNVHLSLTSWKLKEYYLKIILCCLCLDDIVEARNKLQSFSGDWENTREFKFVQDILEAIEQGDVQAFTDTVFNFDQFSKLDKLKTQLLLKIKQTVERDDDDLT